MKIVDLNILLYAVNRDAHHHRTVRSWWEQAVSGDELIGLPWIVLLGFLRIATNPDVFPRPLAPETAIKRIDVWVSHPNTRVIFETKDHWRILKSLIEESGTTGNLTTDAHLATLAISYGAILVSCDTDFIRFKHVRWESPVRQ